MTVRELLEKRANIWSQMKEIITGAKDGVLAAEDAKRYDGFEEELTTLTGAIERASKHAALETAMAQPHNPLASVRAEEPSDAKAKEDHAAFEQFLRGGVNQLSVEHRAVV